jgi:hypothetical protein
LLKGCAFYNIPAKIYQANTMEQIIIIIRNHWTGAGKMIKHKIEKFTGIPTAHDLAAEKRALELPFFPFPSSP